MTGIRDERIPIDPEGVKALLHDLAVARITFQLRGINAVLKQPPPIRPLAPGERPRFEVYPPFDPQAKP